MNKIKITSAISMIILLTLNAWSENPCGIMFPSTDTSSWGIGYIGFTNNTQFVKGITCDTKTVVYIGDGIIRFNNDSIIRLDWNDFNRLGVYNQTCLLKVYEINNTRYKVCSNSLKESIWIEFNDIKSINLHFNTYLALMSPRIEIEHDYIYSLSQIVSMGVNMNNSCLNLRLKPSVDGKLITCLNPNSREGNDITHTHVKILDFDGNWAYVRARKYIYNEELDESGEGCAYSVLNEYYGYVKAIDDNGRPNIWYSGN